MSDATNTDDVAAEIRRHVEALFDAFLAKTVPLSARGGSMTGRVSRSPAAP
jgi:hypothetical protein